MYGILGYIVVLSGRAGPWNLRCTMTTAGILRESLELQLGSLVDTASLI